MLLNFSHPLTEEQRGQLEALLGEPLGQVHHELVDLDLTGSFSDQIVEVLDRVPLSPEEWQTRRVIVNLPGLAPAAAVLLSEIHGRRGHFPSILRVRSVLNSSVTEFEIAEIINLERVRQHGRLRRQDGIDG